MARHLRRRAGAVVLLAWSSALALAACNAISGLSDGYHLRETTPSDTASDSGAAPTQATSSASPPGPSSSADASPDASIDAQAGCWDTALKIVNDWPDLPATPVPNPTLAPGVSHPAHYDTSAPGLVHDDVTGLTWLLEDVDAGPAFGRPNDLAASCAARGARLPTRMELVTLQNWYPADTATSGADPVFPDFVERYYYASTTSAARGTHFYWAAYFAAIGFGIVDGYQDNQDGYVRCVRGPDSVPSSPRHRYEVSQACGVVRDTRTRLEWEQGIGKQGKYTLGEAHCDSLPKMGRNAWRIPTYTELLSIVYSARSDPAIDTEAFTSSSGYYWTASKPARYENNRIVVLMLDGSSVEVRQVDNPGSWTRCVRDVDDQYQ